MSAIVTDNFRILNASNFVDSVVDSSNSYYVFVGLSNPTTSGFGRDSTWDTTQPNPTDNVDYLNHYESTILFGKRITDANVRRVIRKIEWTSGSQYDMYRPDYSVINPAPTTGAMRLYDANYYVVNSQYKVYICIDNGTSGIKTTANSSEVEPTFTDLDPTKLSDGYVWKYLYTISPSDIIKFDSSEYITVPNEWSTSTDSQITAIRENGDSDINDNQIKKVFIKNRGLGYTSGTRTCNLVGDGSGGTVSVTVNSSTQISDVVVTSGGKNYTYALVDLSTTLNPGTYAELVPIIPPSKGHGFDVYHELGADKILIYARFDDSTKDFPVDTKFAQVGILKNPTAYNSSSVYTQNEFSALSGIALTSIINGTPAVGDKIIQTRSDGKKAVGYVASYDTETKILKYYRDRSLYYNGGGGSTNVDFNNMSTYFNSSGIVDFDSSANIGKEGGWSASVDTSISGSTITISNKIINLGVTFTNGFSTPEINNKSGDVIYISNRKTVERDLRQKEDIKIILEF